MTWQVRARVRKTGAIGIFYNVDFILSGTAKDTEETIKNLWFDLHSKDWHLTHFVFVKKID